MNLRTVSNLLLAFASLHPSTRPFLAKYYSASVLLPSDWTTISDLVQTFEEMEGKVGSLPSSLRRVMVPKFEEFDEYQLGKYNKTIKQVWPLTQFVLFAFFKSLISLKCKSMTLHRVEACFLSILPATCL